MEIYCHVSSLRWCQVRHCSYIHEKCFCVCVHVCVYFITNTFTTNNKIFHFYFFVCWIDRNKRNKSFIFFFFIFCCPSATRAPSVLQLLYIAVCVCESEELVGKANCFMVVLYRYFPSSYCAHSPILWPFFIFKLKLFTCYFSFKFLNLYII